MPPYRSYKTIEPSLPQALGTHSQQGGLEQCEINALPKGITCRPGRGPNPRPLGLETDALATCSFVGEFENMGIWEYVCHIGVTFPCDGCVSKSLHSSSSTYFPQKLEFDTENNFWSIW